MPAECDRLHCNDTIGRCSECPLDRPPAASSRSDLDRAILQHIAHRAGEDTDNRDGWCRWSTSDRWPWDWDDYRPLVDRGLLVKRESWKDVMLKLTDAGWMALYAAPATLLPEPRRGVRGQPVDGDLLP